MKRASSTDSESCPDPGLQRWTWALSGAAATSLACVLGLLQVPHPLPYELTRSARLLVASLAILVPQLVLGESIRVSRLAVKYLRGLGVTLSGAGVVGVIYYLDRLAASLFIPLLAGSAAVCFLAGRAHRTGSTRVSLAHGPAASEPK